MAKISFIRYLRSDKLIAGKLFTKLMKSKTIWVRLFKTIKVSPHPRPLQEYLGVVRPPDKGLDFENSLLNLMAGSALLVFVIILCIAVSRRSRKAGSSSTDSLEGMSGVFLGFFLYQLAFISSVFVMKIRTSLLIYSIFQHPLDRNL